MMPPTPPAAPEKPCGGGVRAAGGKGKRSSQPSQFFQKTQMCKFYKAGRCTRGGSCVFAHSVFEKKEKPDLSCTRLCPAVVEGSTCFKANCRYAHSANELRSDVTLGQPKQAALAPNTGLQQPSRRAASLRRQTEFLLDRVDRVPLSRQHHPDVLIDTLVSELTELRNEVAMQLEAAAATQRVQAHTQRRSAQTLDPRLAPRMKANTPEAVPLSAVTFDDLNLSMNMRGGATTFDDLDVAEMNAQRCGFSRMSTAEVPSRTVTFDDLDVVEMNAQRCRFSRMSTAEVPSRTVTFDDLDVVEMNTQKCGFSRMSTAEAPSHAVTFDDLEVVDMNMQKCGFSRMSTAEVPSQPVTYDDLEVIDMNMQKCGFSRMSTADVYGLSSTFDDFDMADRSANLSRNAQTQRAFSRMSTEEVAGFAATFDDLDDFDVNAYGCAFSRMSSGEPWGYECPPEATRPRQRSFSCMNTAEGTPKAEAFSRMSTEEPGAGAYEEDAFDDEWDDSSYEEDVSNRYDFLDEDSDAEVPMESSGECPKVHEESIEVRLVEKKTFFEFVPDEPKAQPKSLRKVKSAIF